MITFRKATTQDIPEIVKVMHETKYANFTFKGKTDQEIAKLIESSPNTYLVCESSNKIVGYFIYGEIKTNLDDAPIKLDKSKAYHLGIGILESHRGQGLGYQLSTFALEQAQHDGYKGMYADVGSNNTNSIKLQEKLGFEQIAKYDSKKRQTGKNVLLEINF